MCQLEKLQANEITEPLAFTVCKLELRGKAICRSHVPGTDVLAMVLFGPGFVLLFIQGLFSVLECFMPTKGFVFESVTTVECKRKMLIC